jgi:hypothetical protein
MKESQVCKVFGGRLFKNQRKSKNSTKQAISNNIVGVGPCAYPIFHVIVESQTAWTSLLLPIKMYVKKNISIKQDIHA